MVLVKREKIKDIPVLHLTKQNIWDEKLPLIIFVHGFTSVKERNLHVAYMLAEKGYRVILPEALLHGERSENLNELELSLRFWSIVKNTIHEIGVIRDEMVEQGLVDSERIGLAGTSMGGIITLGAFAKYPWIKTAVSLMGDPAYIDFAKLQINKLKKVVKELPFTEEELQNEFEGLKEYDPTQKLSDWNVRPLMFWHGQQDPTVPYNSAYSFYEKLKPLYKKANVELSFHLEEKAVHVVTLYAVNETVKWFEKHL
jgi:fermentation-respiration switch protein FrsA (DUF1100 family)